ncbi:MAG: acetylxylan esterase [Lentisphaeria bacterium]|nr:acetylxylan esterase [Lentisphaeria bacterium]
METKVWNLELPPFPREGLNPTLPLEECPVTRLMRMEAARLERLNQFDPPRDLKELKKFQKELRAKIWEKLSVKYDPKVPLKPEFLGDVPKDGFTIRKVIYQSRPGIYVTALLYVPDGRGPFPAVIHMHGHHIDGKFGERQQRMSMAMAKSGYVVLAPDCWGVYERATVYRELEYHGGFLGAALMNVGETLMGEQLADNMRGVDFLRSLPFVRKDRIGATGASGGGNQTMWLSAMDERIAAAMPVVSVGSFETYVAGTNCMCELLPDGLKICTEAAVLGLIAPRPLRIGNAYYDVNPTFGVESMLQTYHQVEKLYWNLGCGDNLAYTVADRVHGMWDRQRSAVLGWFDCHLRGHGHGSPVPDVELDPLPIDEICLFESPEKRPAKIRTTDVHCTRLGTALRKKMLAQKKIDADAKRIGLVEMLRLRPLPSELPLKRHADADGLERYTLDAGDHLIPVLVKRGRIAGKFRVLLSPAGKSDLSEADVAAAPGDGSSVVMFDLIGTGETARPNMMLGTNHQYTRQMLWLGRSILGEWARDIFAVVRMLREQFRVKKLVIEARREAGVTAVFAAGTGLIPFEVKAVDAPSTFLFSRESIPSFTRPAYGTYLKGNLYGLGLALPGFLVWGDISLAAALADKVEFVSPRAYDGTPLKPAAEQAFRKEIAALRAKM